MNNINLFSDLLEIFGNNNNNNNYDYFNKIPFNIENNPISLEQIISNHKGIKEEFKCPICLNFVYNPLKCSNCENIFCLNCIDNLNTNCSNDKCPFNCEDPDYIEIDRKLKNILNSTEISCFYKKNGCNEIISYENYVNHCNNCDYCDYKCSAENCDFEGNLEQIQKHIFICDKRFKICPRCNLKFDFKFYDKHFNEDCDFIEKECNNCHFKLLKKDFNSHSKENCLENQVLYWKNKYFNATKNYILQKNYNSNDLFENLNSLFN